MTIDIHRGSTPSYVPVLSQRVLTFPFESDMCHFASLLRLLAWLATVRLFQQRRRLRELRLHVPLYSFGLLTRLRVSLLAVAFVVRLRNAAIVVLPLQMTTASTTYVTSLLTPISRFRVFFLHLSRVLCRFEKRTFLCTTSDLSISCVPHALRWAAEVVSVGEYGDCCVHGKVPVPFLHHIPGRPTRKVFFVLSSTGGPGHVDRHIFWYHKI
jgi:hypothetical protein